ncbi:MAG: rRNA maturation RNase YbeY [Bacilli bacterium]|nr:rRNA maturation RNase YbeY [Bacilli bacterium]
MNTIEIFNETKYDVREISEMKKLIKYALKYEKLDNVEFDIILVDNTKIKELNRDYRKIDKETDVISFAFEDYKPVIYDKIRVLGDIYISLDKAKEQANDYDHSLLRELCFLMIHGFLHLLGYDHINEEDEKIMFKKQKEILENYGIKKTR